MMIKKYRFVLELIFIAIFTLISTSCAYDLGEHDVGLVEIKMNAELDPDVNYCEHSYRYDSSVNHTSSSAYPTSMYHYVYCTFHDSFDHCLFAPTFERHTLVEDDRFERKTEELYNGRTYECITLKCSKCNQLAGYKYVFIDEVDR